MGKFKYYLLIAKVRLKYLISNILNLNDKSITITFNIILNNIATYKHRGICKSLSLREYIVLAQSINNIPYKDICSVTGFNYVKIGNKQFNMLSNYNLYEFILNHKEDNQEVLITLEYGGIGGECHLNDKLILEVDGDHNHNQRPHVHIKRRDGVSVHVDLFGDISPKPYRIWMHKFNRKERNRLLKIIDEKKENFIKFYKQVSNGEVPESVSFIYDGKECELSYKDTYLVQF